ncbi:MAG: DNA/RNA nuclease SfsA [Puniceicoccales bacterium]|jgi:DNA-binding sugar fermentation-stimulating protein|nr:DNA/RNA nuclease SfsA [Puniceicoccales bacterium]
MSISLNLVRGTLLRRPNRFVFEGTRDGQEEQRWHCPVTGSIGGVKDFLNIPCLLTPKNMKNGRTTSGTVEAISLDGGSSWIGINQNRINGWVEQLLLADALPDMLPCGGATIRHEVAIGKSRLDLVVERDGRTTYLEIKTPMHHLFLPGAEPYHHRPTYAQFFERLMRHYILLTELAKAGNRAMAVLCFLYDAPPFAPPERDRWNGPTMDVVARAQAAGVENWQLNLDISQNELRVKHIIRPSMAPS